MAIYDFLMACTDDSTNVYVYDMENGDQVFIGEIHDALESEEDWLEEDLSSWDYDPMSGLIGINF